jgi:hypothetical protein
MAEITIIEVFISNKEEADKAMDILFEQGIYWYSLNEGEKYFPKCESYYYHIDMVSKKIYYNVESINELKKNSLDHFINDTENSYKVYNISCVENLSILSDEGLYEYFKFGLMGFVTK